MRKRSCSLLFRLILTLFALVDFSSGQRPPQGFQSQNLMLGGRVVTCSSAGQPVRWIADYTLNDGGHTMPGFLVIVYNPNVLDTFPDALKLWAMGHECGHAYNQTADENAADCWSIKMGIRQGWFRESDFDDLVQLFRNNSGDLNHPPGPVRIANMRTCMNSALGNHQPPPSDRIDSDEEAGNCVEAGVSGSVQWHKTVEDPTVHYRYDYENNCDKAVKCSVTVAVGNRPRNSDLDDFDDWTLTDQKVNTFVIPANSTRWISGTLTWDISKPPNMMPSLRKSKLRNTDEDWKTKCVFTH